MAFVIKQITVYNYTADNSKLSGTVEFSEKITGMKMSVNLTPDDAARIFEVFADRISAVVQEAATSVITEIRAAQPVSLPFTEVPPDGEIPF